MLYTLAVGEWGIQPSEFWQMPPRHFSWLWRAKHEAAKKMREETARAGGKKTPGLSKKDAKEIYDLLKQRQREEQG